MAHWGLTLNLRDGPGVAERYREAHRSCWPEVVSRLREIGVRRMWIFLSGRRLFMVVEADEGFDPARDFPRALDDPRYREWDVLMRTLQEPAPEAAEGEWWAGMEEVFDLDWQFGEAR
jgi:L-rhamnose mutarotase